MAHRVHNNWTRRLGPFNLSAMVCGLCEIVDGVIRVVSLGNLHWPNLAMRFIFWHAIWECKRNKAPDIVEPAPESPAL